MQNKINAIIIFLFTLCLVSCIDTSPVRNKPVFFNVDLPKYVIGTTKVKVTIKNNSEGVVIPTVFELEGLQDASLNWVTQIYGQLVFDKEKNQYFYDPLVRMQSPGCFYSYFLLPGEKEEFSLEINLPESKKRKFIFHYFYLETETFLKLAYIPMAAGNQPQEEFRNPSLGEIRQHRKKPSLIKYFILRDSNKLTVFSEEKEI